MPYCAHKPLCDLKHTSCSKNLTPAWDTLSEGHSRVIECSQGKLRGRGQFKGGLFSKLRVSRPGNKGTRLGPALSAQPGTSEMLITYSVVSSCCSKACVPTNSFAYYHTANGKISFR